MTSRTSQALLLGLSILPSIALAASKRVCASDPFADPKNDPCDVLGYVANNTLTMIATIVFLLIALVHSIQMIRYRTWWMIAMVVGLYTFVLGFVTRFGLHSKPQSQSLFKAEYLLIVLSPCAFIASDYAVLGHLATFIDASKYVLLPARRITIIFVTSDIATFIIQAIGGVIAVTSTETSKRDVGNHIALAGFILQLVSFTFFFAIYARFLFLLYTRGTEVTRSRKNSTDVWYKGWRAISIALLLSCTGIEIRSIYRTIEFVQGFRGTLATSEVTFYALDTLPLLLAVVVYVPFWPGRLLKKVPEHISESEIPLEDAEGRL